MPKQLQPTDIARVLRLLGKAYPEPKCALDHKNAFELLVATILSAQCTDRRVNLVTPELFGCYPNAQALAAATPEHIEALIHSTGFFRNKAKNLIGMAQALCAQHSGCVPKTLAELVALPGVARKTANVVLGVSFERAEGIVVDTHVMRLAQRLGLTERKTPVHIEQDLMACIPKKHWIGLSHRLIWHGRQVCVARRPRCPECTLNGVCPAAQLA